MRANNNTAAYLELGIGLPGLVFLTLLLLKVCGAVAWSWWWITSPLWIAGIIALGVLLAICLMILVGVGLAWMMLGGK